MGKTFVARNPRKEEYDEIRRRRDAIKKRLEDVDDEDSLRPRKLITRQRKWDDKSWDND